MEAGHQRKRQKVSSGKETYQEPDWSRTPEEKFTLLHFRKRKLLEEISISISSCYILGRSGSLSDIKVAHESISRQHAVIQFGTGPSDSSGHSSSTSYTNELISYQMPWIYDLGSSHGTFVNKKRLAVMQYIQLNVGDVLEFGTLEDRYVLSDPEHVDSLMAAKGTYQPAKNVKPVVEMKEAAPLQPFGADLEGQLFVPNGRLLSASELKMNPYERISAENVESNGIFDDDDDDDSSEDEAHRFSKDACNEKVDFVLHGIISKSERSSSQEPNSSTTPWMTQKSHDPEEMKYFGGWEKHTKGIGLKILKKFGYVKGTSLGKHERQGIINPIIPVICAQRASLDNLEGDLSTAKGRKAAELAKETRRRMLTGEGVDPVAIEEQKQLRRIVDGAALGAEKSRIRVTDTHVFEVMNQHCVRALHETDANTEETGAQFLKKARDEALAGIRSNLQALRRKLLRVRLEKEDWKKKLQTLSGQTREFKNLDGTQRQFQEHVKMATTDSLLQARQMFRYLSHQETAIKNRIEVVDRKNIRKRRKKKIF